jgi:hypothetical protein
MISLAFQRFYRLHELKGDVLSAQAVAVDNGGDARSLDKLLRDYLSARRNGTELADVNSLIGILLAERAQLTRSRLKMLSMRQPRL